MARPTLYRHRKFLRLSKALGSQALALGSLELIWGCCYEAGEDQVGTADDVELVADWKGEPGALVQALVEAGGEGADGFLEVIPGTPTRYRVHDLLDHAPDYVRKRRAREDARRPQPDSDRHPADNGGEWQPQEENDRSVTGQRQTTAVTDRSTADNGGQRRTVADNGSTPAPAPAPAPAPTPLGRAPSELAQSPPERGPSADPPPEERLPEQHRHLLELEFPVVGQGPGVWRPPERILVRILEAFPALDLEHQLRKAILWLDANPKKRKTISGMPRFLSWWFGYAQNRGEGAAGEGSRASPRARVGLEREFERLKAQAGERQAAHG